MRSLVCVCVSVFTRVCVFEKEREVGSLEVIRKVAPFTMENWLLFWHYPHPHPPPSPLLTVVVWIAGVNNQIWAWVCRAAAALLISLMPPSKNFVKWLLRRLHTHIFIYGQLVFFFTKRKNYKTFGVMVNHPEKVYWLSLREMTNLTM